MAEPFIMRVFGILLILLLLPFIAFPEENREGSGKTEGIRQIDSLLELARSCRDSNLVLALQAAGEAGEIASQVKDIQCQVRALTLLSSLYLAKKEYLKSVDYLFKIVDIYETAHDVNNLIMAYTKISQFFLGIKDDELAKKYVEIASGLAPRTSDTRIHGQIFLTFAQYYLFLKNDSLAVRSLYLALCSVEKAKDTLTVGVAYKYLGDAFVHAKRYSDGVYAYRMAVNIYSQLNNYSELAIIYTRIAHIYQEIEDNSKNLAYNLKALRLREKTGQLSLVASSFQNVGEAYWLLGRKDSANYYLMKSLKLAKQLNNSYFLEAIYFQLSIFANAEKRYKDALGYYQSCMENRIKLNQQQSKSDIILLEANRSIRASEAQNDLMRQENLYQELQFNKRRIQTFFIELVFILLLLLLLFFDTLVRSNRRRKNELKGLNDRLKQEIFERIEAEGRLNRSEELHRFLAENTVDVISLLDAGMHRVYISPSCEKFYGYTQQEILAMDSPLDLLNPTYRVAVNQRLLEMYRTKKPTRYIYKARRKDGVDFWAEANINPILDEDTNEVRDLITVVRDISERMKHEEELAENARQKEYLLREIHNRVKNNFTILTSLMNMQRDQTADTELNRSITDLQLRVRTMSLVHEQLYKNQEISSIPFDNYLQHLALIISSSFDNERITVETDIRPCQIAIEMALPMGLIINELITNVYKYAFPCNNSGILSIKLLPEEEGKYSVTIRDNGIGLPEDFAKRTTQSMGTQIVQILIQQVEAQLDITNEGGACFRILFSPNQ